jgi:hypothetical protein
MSIIILRSYISHNVNSYIHLATQWSYVEFTLFCNGFTLKTQMTQEILNLSDFVTKIEQKFKI